MKIEIKNDWCISSSGVIAGTIFIKENEWAFPCFGYTDFPILCISSWIDVMIHLNPIYLHHSRFQENLLFFDGPYVISIVHNPSTCEVSLTFYNGLSIVGDSIVGDDEQKKLIIDIRRFVVSLIETSNKIIKLASLYEIELDELKDKTIELSQCKW